jgi:uncharacterized membrane protein YjfL (UPF0719 family)
MTLNSLGIALAYATVGILLFACAFVLLGKLLPGQLWREAVEEKNLAAAIVLAAVALALGWIVAAVAH